MALVIWSRGSEISGLNSVGGCSAEFVLVLGGGQGWSETRGFGG